MSDDTFRRKLDAGLGAPPPAPAGELSRILARARPAERRRRYLQTAACALSVLFAVVTVTVVKPESGRDGVENFVAGAATSPYDTSLEPYRGLMAFVSADRAHR